MHTQNKGVAVHTVDMDFKRVKRNLNIKILLQYVWKGNGPGCKINIGESKRQMAAQKVDMGELLGEKTITDFLMVPPRDWWEKVTKTLLKMKSQSQNRDISLSVPTVYLFINFFWCWLFVSVWRAWWGWETGGRSLHNAATKTLIIINLKEGVPRIN